MNNPIQAFAAALRHEFKGYNPQTVQRDLMAGVTVAAVALPLALAFGVNSGADAAAGLITAILAAFVIGALSGASFQISGPTGAMTAILLPLASRMGLEGVFLAGLLAGGILLLAGLLRMGKLVYFLPTPVISGFTSGIAIIIALGQVDNLFGVQSIGENALQKLGYLITNGFAPNPWALGIGLFVIVFMLLWPKKWGAKLPASLLAIALVTAANAAFHFPVAAIGRIPQTLIHESRITLADLRGAQWNQLLLPGVSIAALCMIESLLCGVAAGRMKDERMDGDRELMAQGIGNLLLPFFGGVPATAAIARTSVAIKSGQATRVTGIVHGVILLLSMFFLTPLMAGIPLCALAGILIVTAWRMNEWHNIKYIFGHRFYSDIAAFGITMLATVVFDLTIAIAAGVIFSILYFVVRSAQLDVALNEIEPERLGYAIELPERTQVMYVTGPVFFGSVDALAAKLALTEANTLIVSMRGVPLVDISGVQALTEILQKSDKKLLFACVQPNVQAVFRKAGLSALVHGGTFFETAKEAIEYLGKTE